MCQSKAEGGIRCHSHAHEALAASEDKYVDLVVSKAAETTGWQPWPRETYFGSPYDSLRLETMLSGDTAVAKARVEKEQLEDELDTCRAEIQYGVEQMNVKYINNGIRRADPEITDLIDKRDGLISEARREIAKANATDDNEHIGQVRAKYTKAISEVEKKLSATQEKTMAEAQAIYEASRSMPRDADIKTIIDKAKPASISALEKANSEAQRKRMVLEAEKTKLYKNRIAGYNMREDENFKDIEKFPGFRSSDEFFAWRKKNASLRMDYAISNTSMANLEYKISDTSDPEQKKSLLEKQKNLMNVREAIIRKNKESAKV